MSGVYVYVGKAMKVEGFLIDIRQRYNCQDLSISTILVIELLISNSFRSWVT